jgi:preprotein translocase subunit SecG
LLLRRLVLLVLLILLIFLILLLLISRPRKGGIPIIFSMSRLTSSLMLHNIPGALLLMP